MQEELLDLFKAYLMGWKNLRDCAEWFSSIDWSSNIMNSTTQNALGGMELIVTEVLEGLRPESEFWKEASKTVAAESGMLFTEPMAESTVSFAESSNAKIDKTPFLTFPEEAEVEGSQSWSISPLPAVG